MGAPPTVRWLRFPIYTNCVCVCGYPRRTTLSPLALHHLQPVKPSQIPQLTRGLWSSVLPTWSLGKERTQLTPVRRGPCPRDNGSSRVGVRRDGRRKEPVGARGAKVRVLGRTGGDQGLKGCGAISLEGQGGDGLGGWGGARHLLIFCPLRPSPSRKPHLPRTAGFAAARRGTGVQASGALDQERKHL